MAFDVRAAAGRVIGAVLAGHSLNQALPPALGRVSKRDRGLLQQLCYGTLRHGPRRRKHHQNGIIKLIEETLI